MKHGLWGCQVWHQLETLDGVTQFESECGKKTSWLHQQEQDWGSAEKRERSKWRRWWRLWWGPVWQGTTSSVCLAKLIRLVHSLQGFVPWYLYFSNFLWWAHLPSCHIRNSGYHQSELLPTFITRAWRSSKSLEPKSINNFEYICVYWVYICIYIILYILYIYIM